MMFYRLRRLRSEKQISKFESQKNNSFVIKNVKKKLFFFKKLMPTKLFLLNLFGGQNVLQNGNFCLCFENSRNGPILRLQMRAKEEFNRDQFFSTNKQ